MPGALHALERRLLRALAKGERLLKDAAAEASIGLDQARRAAEWLKAKGLVEAEAVLRREVIIGEEGLKAVKAGLPERRLGKLLASGGGRVQLEEIRRRFKGTEDEFSAALGYAKAKGWVSVAREEDSLYANLGTLPRTTPHEEALKSLVKGRHFYDDLPREHQKALDELAKRPGYWEERPSKEARLRLTADGRAAASMKEEVREVEALTPHLLTAGRWRRVRLRPLDVEAATPILYPGKKHPVQLFIDEVREIFSSLGFQEVEGPLVQPCFWNFDALFIPQDHSAREMQDTFYVSGLTADRVGDDGVGRAIAAVHEDGGGTGSKGWGYGWRQEEARRLVLRTHTTAVTVKYLADERPSEARVFSVGRVFRNEKVTYKNLVEFHQIEGITVGKSVTLRDMMGLLTTFYRKLGLEKVKFWPSYFPYTEPSLQSVVYLEESKKWVEVCGMGIFRPEVTLPLGVTNPVLAWGGGLERLVMLRYGVDDIRRLYENNLRWLRSAPLCR